MRKTSLSSSSSSNTFGGFLSPGAPSYTHTNKGWSSERLPHPPSKSPALNGLPRRRIGSTSALTTPFYSGRSIPSKWEDAERWISVSSQFSKQRREKSKSGPIVPPPTLPRQRMAMEAPQGSVKKGFTVVGSPFSTGVLEAERVFRGSVGGGHGHGHSQSCADLISDETSSLSSKTDIEEKGEETIVVTRRDIATQMTPNNNNNNNNYSSQELSPPLVVSVVETDNHCREVKMDKGARMIKRPKRRVLSSSSSTRIIRRDQHEVEDNPKASSWDISEPAMTLFKLHREEAKIAAWENLQKAKAEAAMRKLEVKLEKKKSASMDKIFNKLQTAKLKAQEMRRSTVTSDHHQKEQQISRNSAKVTHLVRRHTFMTPFITCFVPRVDCRKSSSAL
ncbi:unnamed protein product [Eruca vesicaria subsp. sativa]|uniref:Remorin C-terminal domain-containing protein n=1 Tax=Eruca vesicaria subsp. sativa TaxID=29727 RepID=A0ABC8M9N0_ERUVS|nr:unnamed protein product [Eruca vesicaria subsp. sativa]